MNEWERSDPSGICAPERALADEVKLLALTIDERAIILGPLEDPSKALAELRAVLLDEHQWRQREALD